MSDEKLKKFLKEFKKAFAVDYVKIWNVDKKTIDTIKKVSIYHEIDLFYILTADDKLMIVPIERIFELRYSNKGTLTYTKILMYSFQRAFPDLFNKKEKPSNIEVG